MPETSSGSPIFVRMISTILFLFGSFAFPGLFFLWREGFLFGVPEGVDYAFPMTELFVNTPGSLLAAIGLWKMQRYGFATAYFVAGFYICASVEIFVRVLIISLWKNQTPFLVKR